jgi:hypothetical protein
MDAKSDTADSNTPFVETASRDWDREEAGRGLAERDEAERDEGVEREEEERELVERDEDDVREEEVARDEDDEREEVEREAEVAREFLERVDESRELEERSVVACERVPRRVDSFTLMAHQQQSSSSGQIHPMVIHLLQQHRDPLCPPSRQLLRQQLREYRQL